MSWIEEQIWFGLEPDEIIETHNDNNELLHKKLWRTAAGRTLRIEEMSTQHIENCIKRIESSGEWRLQYLQVLKDELKKRYGK